MALAEFDIDEVRNHRSSVTAPSDLHAFWTQTIAEARSRKHDPQFKPCQSPLAVIDTVDVTFSGFAGDPIRGWLHVPAGTTRPLPVVIEYPGYGGGRGLAHQTTLWAQAGLAHFVMDVRGQGATWSVGETADPHPSGPSYPGVLTRGIENRDSYYYRRLITDAVLAVDAAREHPLVQSDVVAVAGCSQGGLLAISAAALADNVHAAIPEVPAFCDTRRAVRLTDEQPYTEISGYLAAHRAENEQVFDVLRYFDGAVLASLGHIPALFSVGLSDLVCLPSTVYAAYNAWPGEKSIIEYEFNGHEGGGAHHDAAKINWLKSRIM